MLEALVFWGLALYGAVTLIVQSVQRIQRPLRRRHPVKVVLVVHNAAKYIEGILRTLILKTAMSPRDRQIVVIDVASNDETDIIVTRLSKEHPCVTYVRADDEPSITHQIERICLHSHHVGCVFDLRDETPQEIAEDLAYLCQS